MTRYIDPWNAKLGDRVIDMVSPMGGDVGRVCGIDTQDGALLVRYDGKGASIDVIGFYSPVWSVFAVRTEAKPDEPLKIALDGTMSIGGKAVVGVVRDDAWLHAEPVIFNEAAFIERQADTPETVETPGTIKSPVVTLPWSN